MSQVALTAVQFNAMNWGDAQLRNVEWLRTAPSLRLAFELAGPGEKSRRLELTWASALEFELRFGANEGGPPMLWDARAETLSDSRMRVTLDFAGAGSLRLICNDISVFDGEQTE